MITHSGSNEDIFTQRANKYIFIVIILSKISFFPDFKVETKFF